MTEQHPQTGRAPIDVMMITFNEAVNLPHSLGALQGWANKVFVVDSGSTDGSQEIARSFGAEVVHHDWPGYARQKNWGLDNLPFESPWILIVDADEVITERLRKRLVDTASHPVEDVAENGFFIKRLTYFLGAPIRHCGFFPNWNMRFFERGADSDCEHEPLRSKELKCNPEHCSYFGFWEYPSLLHPWPPSAIFPTCRWRPPMLPAVFTS